MMPMIHKAFIQSGVQPLGYKDYSENYNAMRVIKSYDLIKQTVDKLDLDVSYYIKGRIRTKEIYDDIPFKISFKAINPMLYSQFIEFKILNVSKYSLKYKLGENEITQEGYFNKALITKDLSLVVTKSSGHTSSY
jgi:tyrosine-protein kinase Etk/Wzc